jgi:NAD-dependent DNA ligase
MQEKYNLHSEVELINLYNKSKELYYSDGTSSLSDSEFDELEKFLLEHEKIEQKVGGSVNNVLHEKIEHYYPMLSLDKIKSKDSTDLPVAISDLYKWINVRKRFIQQSSDLISGASSNILITPKYDGNAINLQFNNYKFEKALSRGNGKEGRNITEYIEPIVNSKNILIVENLLKDLNISGKIEIRGELIIKNETFVDKYYGDYKNPRNFIAGILNNKTTDSKIFEDCDIFFFDLKYDGINKSSITVDIESKIFETLSTSPKKSKILNLDSSVFNITYLTNIIEECQNEFLSSKDYEHDGLVFTLDSNVKFLFPDKSNYPDHTIAFKFEPECAYTEVLRIEWNTGTSSRIVPTVFLKPVDLVGSTISKVTGFNAKFILDNNLREGSLVKIAKAGDIIPVIIDVLPNPKNVNPDTSELTISCTCGNYSAKLKDCKLDNDIHLNCEVLSDAMDRMGLDINPTKECHAFYKLYETRLKAFNINGLGPAYIKDFYSCPELQMDIMDFFFKSQDLIPILLKNDINVTKNHRTIVESVQPGNIDINIWNIVYSLCVDGLGKSLSKEVEKYLTGDNTYNFAGFNKDVVAMFMEEPFKAKLKVIEKIDKLLKLGYNLPYKIGKSAPPSSSAENTYKQINIEMTGTPPSTFGIKNKFMEKLNKESIKSGIKFIPTKLSGAKILITDSMSSSSTKMKAARKKGIPIYTYTNLYEIFSKNNNSEISILNSL